MVLQNMYKDGKGNLVGREETKVAVFVFLLYKR